jgi:hypothetical protein
MENIQALLESSKYTSLNASDTASMKLMLENTEKEHARLVNEGTLAGDVAQFTPILMPMVRRVYPNLIANEILGVQPMAMPTGFIYSLTNQYTGTGVAGQNGNLKIIETADIGSVVSIYSEGDLHLVAKDDAELANITITATFTNEAAFGKILKGYTGSYTTAQAEALSTDMKEIGFSVERKNVTAKSRALKGQYTVEMYQDLKAQHGLLADEEIMSLMSYEMQAELDREVVDFVNGNATQLADSTFTASAGVTGRWEIERYRTEAIRLSKEAAQIGLDTKRGQGNTLLVSPKVATMLEQLGGFAASPVAGNVSAPVSGGVAGTFDGRFKVIVDQYATSDYATVMYKGADRRDAMGFFCPYVPMSFTKVTNADSGQPAVIAKTRYALDTIPGISTPESNDRAATYARSFGIDFTNTKLA